MTFTASKFARAASLTSAEGGDTPQADPASSPPSATGLPTDVTVTEDVASILDLSAATLVDTDTTGEITVVLTASAGRIMAGSDGVVTVTGAYTGTLTLSGTATAIDAFLNTPSAISYTGASNAFGDNAATVTVTADDGSGVVTLGVVNIDITGTEDAPQLSGLATTLSFHENDFNSGPVLIDADVTFSDPDGPESNYNGGRLVVGFLSSQDVVSIRNEGTGEGQVGFNSTTGNVTYGGVVIGRASGGTNGSAFSINFNTNTRAYQVDALIQNLTYANYSNAPTASHTILLNVFDSGSGLRPDALSIQVNIIGDNDAPTATGLPTDVTVNEGVASSLNLSAVTLADADTTGAITVVLTASAGTMTATTGGGVTVTGSASGVLTLSGTATAIDTFLNTASNIQYTGASNASGDNAATLTVTADDGSGAVTLGVVNIDIAALNDAPVLTGLSASVSLSESEVNAGAVIIDSAVSFSDPDGPSLNYGDGRLVVSDLRAEDVVSVRNQGSGEGQIGFNSLTGEVSYQGVVIGVATGGRGDTLTIEFNNNARSDQIGPLIQNLTYANSSNDPASSRTLRLDVFDGASGLNGGPQSINILVTAENDAPALTGLTETVTFQENTVNTAPQLLDATVEFTDPDGRLAEGVLTVSSSLTEDILGIRNQGTGAGQIGFADGRLTYGGSFFGTVEIRAGYLRVSLAPDAPPAGVDALIQNLTYANLSDEPTPRRVITLSVTDGSGGQAGGSITVNVTPERDDIVGTPGNDILVGTGAADIMRGLGGDDSMDGGAGADNIEGNDGDDTLVGGAGNDQLFGGAGADSLTGGAGADVLTGGTGDDTYVIDSTDTLVENPNEGVDTIVVGITWTLAANFENLTLSGGGNLAGTGNAADNVITGNSGANVLEGLAGNDTLNGGGGNDTLNGGEGDDTLDGGAGHDAMNGGAGNDLYIIDNAGDITTEQAGGGTDTARVTISSTLGANIENLELAGVAALSGTGNSLDNLITGNAGGNVLSGMAGNDRLIGGGGDDTLDGGAGADWMDGGDGNDTYVVDNLGDSVSDSGGDLHDLVRTDLASYTLGEGIEDLTGTSKIGQTLTGNAADNIINGGQLGDTLYGGAGNDRLIGNGGVDTLYGGAGADAFVITIDSGAPAPKGQARGDVIADFNQREGDWIDLSAIDANTTRAGMQSFTFVQAFTKHAGEAVYSFSKATGNTTLALDVNGDGAADAQVTILNVDLTGGPANAPVVHDGVDKAPGWFL